MNAVQHLKKSPPTHTAAELVGRGLFKVVRFIDHEVVIRGDRAAAGGQVGEQEGMVHDQDMGGFSRLPGAEEEAGSLLHVAVRTCETVRILGGETRPRLTLVRIKVQFRAITSLRVR